jgi:hypothetical protein
VKRGEGMLKRIAGGFMLLLGAILLCWIGYNLLIERHPVTQGQSPIPALGFCAALFYVGIMWVRGKTAE